MGLLLTRRWEEKTNEGIVRILFLSLAISHGGRLALRFFFHKIRVGTICGDAPLLDVPRRLCFLSPRCRGGR